jgi:hypothetical protein
MLEINVISISAIPPSATADFAVLVLQTEVGQCRMIMETDDYHLLTSTDFFHNKYASFKEDHKYIQKQTA